MRWRDGCSRIWLPRHASPHRREGNVRPDEGSRMTVWVYINTAKEVGDEDHLKVFATEDAAERWFAEHDPEGVAFEYPVFT